MKPLLLVIVAIVLAVAGMSVYSACGEGECRGIGNFRFLQLHDEVNEARQEYQKLLMDPRFMKVDVYGVSEFIDNRAECNNFKRAVRSLSLLDNNINDARSTESKVEAILIYHEARKHGCNID